MRSTSRAGLLGRLCGNISIYSIVRRRGGVCLWLTRRGEVAMPTFPLYVRPVFRMLLVLPFRLGADFVPLAAARRRAAFLAVAAELDRCLPAFAWQSIPF